MCQQKEEEHCIWLSGPSANADATPRTEDSQNRHQHDALCFSLTVVKWVVVMPSLSRIQNCHIEG